MIQWCPCHLSISSKLICRAVRDSLDKSNFFTVSVHVCVWNAPWCDTIQSYPAFPLSPFTVFVLSVCCCSDFEKWQHMLLHASVWHWHWLHWLIPGGTTVTGHTKVVYLSLIGLDGGFCSGGHVDFCFVMYCMNSKWICGTSWINVCCSSL